jgi:Tfp pilus tip-associated adhesin PilY1
MVKDVYYDSDGDNDKEWRTVLVCSEGRGGNYLFALDVTDPDNWSVLWEATDTEAPGGMGHAYRVALNRVKWPVYEGEEVTGYEIKWVVFVATGRLNKVEDQGGINVFAYDLETGVKEWHFSQGYDSSVNDIPGAITLFDTTGDGFIDRVYVGDMDGRLWELNAVDGTNPHGTDEVDVTEEVEGEVVVVDTLTKQVPLWNAGVGNPISVSPAVVRVNPVIVIFGTGGTDWAADDQRYHIYAVNATNTKAEADITYADGAGNLWWDAIELGVGEKVYSAPTIAAGRILVATVFGDVESDDPSSDLVAEGENSGNLYSFKVADGTQDWTISNIGKSRGAIFVDRQHLYLTTIHNDIIQVGDGNFAQGNANNVILRTWRQF